MNYPKYIFNFEYSGKDSRRYFSIPIESNSKSEALDLLLIQNPDLDLEEFIIHVNKYPKKK